MADRPKLLYILVQDEEVPGSENEVKAPWPRYTRPLLQSTLQLMGCKPRHAFKVQSFEITYLVIGVDMYCVSKFHFKEVILLVACSMPCFTPL